MHKGKFVTAAEHDTAGLGYVHCTIVIHYLHW